MIEVRLCVDMTDLRSSGFRLGNGVADVANDGAVGPLFVIVVGRTLSPVLLMSCLTGVV